MADRLRIQAPAKLNLFLHVNARGSDGYHRIQTLFQPIGWYDRIMLTLQPDASISVFMSAHGVVLPTLPEQDNLVYRAAWLLQQHTGVGSGVRIHLEKHIPAGAGLGGGSSDAAATLLALNQLWQTGFSVEDLAILAAQLGADVPVMLYHTSALAEGRGERIFPLRLPPLWFLVFMPHCHCDTRTVFQQPQLTRDSQIMTMSLLKKRLEASITGLSDLRNDCQAVVRSLHAEIDKLFAVTEVLTTESFSKPRLTGTGAAVFMMFTSRQQAEKVQHDFLARYPDHGLQSLKLVPVHTGSVHVT